MCYQNKIKEGCFIWNSFNNYSVSNGNYFPRDPSGEGWWCSIRCGSCPWAYNTYTRCYPWVQDIFSRQRSLLQNSWALSLHGSLLNRHVAKTKQYNTYKLFSAYHWQSRWYHGSRFHPSPPLFLHIYICLHHFYWCWESADYCWLTERTDLESKRREEIISVTEGKSPVCSKLLRVKNTALVWHHRTFHQQTNSNLKVKCNFVTSIFFPLHTALLHLSSKIQSGFYFHIKWLGYYFPPRYFECRNDPQKNNVGRLDIANMKTFWLQILNEATWVWKTVRKLIEYPSSHNN